MCHTGLYRAAFVFTSTSVEVVRHDGALPPFLFDLHMDGTSEQFNYILNRLCYSSSSYTLLFQLYFLAGFKNLLNVNFFPKFLEFIN